MPDDLAEVEVEVMRRMDKYFAEQAALPPEERDCNKKRVDSNGNAIPAVVAAAL